MKLNEALSSVKASLPNDNDILKIIDICQLFPKENSWRTWIDGQGNCITLTQNKKIICSKYKLLTYEDTVITDLYCRAPIEKLSKCSTWVFIIFGKDIDSGIDVIYIWFLGIDNRLRLSYFDGKNWIENQPPLSCGIKTLQVLVKNFDISDYNVVLNGQLCDNKQVNLSIAMKWPPSSSAKSELLLNNNDLAQKVFDTCEI